MFRPYGTILLLLAARFGGFVSAKPCGQVNSCSSCLYTGDIGWQCGEKCVWHVNDDMFENRFDHKISTRTIESFTQMLFFMKFSMYVGMTRSPKVESPEYA